MFQYSVVKSKALKLDSSGLSNGLGIRLLTVKVHYVLEVEWKERKAGVQGCWDRFIGSEAGYVT